MDIEFISDPEDIEIITEPEHFGHLTVNQLLLKETNPWLEIELGSGLSRVYEGFSFYQKKKSLFPILIP